MEPKRIYIVRKEKKPALIISYFWLYEYPVTIFTTFIQVMNLDHAKVYTRWYNQGVIFSFISWTKATGTGSSKGFNVWPLYPAIQTLPWVNLMRDKQRARPGSPLNLVRGYLPWKLPLLNKTGTLLCGYILC